MLGYRTNPDRSEAPVRDPAVETSLLLAAILLAIGLTLATVAPAAAAQPQPFKVTNIHFETNASACDMGIQIGFDTEGITEGSVEDPNDRVVYSFRSSAGMADTGGQTEGFLEGVEPQIEELISALGCERSSEEPVIPIQELLDAWPKGTYDFEGSGGGVTYEDQAVLSYHIPAGPQITAPAPGTVVPHDQPLLIKWNQVTSPILPSLGPVTIVGYHIVVVETGAEALPQLDIDVARGETSLTVPKQYLEPKKTYQFEVLATDRSGNQTISEGFFCTIGVAACEAP